MKKTMSDLQILRMNILGGMNEYVRELGDEDLWEIWIEVFPDECDEDELAEIAGDDSIWLSCVERFAYVCKQAGII